MRQTRGERAASGRLRETEACLLLYVLLASAAAAQPVPPLGPLEDRFEDGGPPRPVPLPAPVIPRIEQPPAPADAANVRFVLSGVVVEGATVYGPEAFVPAYEKQLAREISLAELYEIAGAITAIYERDGYVLTRAIVPEQRVGLGVVRIEVIEGSITDVVVRGHVRGRKRVLEDYGRKIGADHPTSLAVLERYVLLMDDLPGVTAQVSVLPVEGSRGGHRLTVFLENTPVTGFARADNRGTRYVGPYQAWLTAEANSLLGLYDQTRLRAVAASPFNVPGLAFLEAAHGIVVGSEGTTTSLLGNWYRARPGSSLEPLDVEVTGLRFELSAAHPLHRSYRSSLFLTGRLRYRDEQTELLGRTLTDPRIRMLTVADDRIRSVALGATAWFGDPLGGSNVVALELSQGLDVLGASKPGALRVSRLGASSDFTKLTLEASRTQPLGRGWELFLVAKGQKSSDPLLVPEQMGLGGEVFGSAYDPWEIAGDDGAAVRVELRRGGPLEIGPLRGAQLYHFYDFGTVWTQAAKLDGEELPSAGVGALTAAASGRESLASTGLGLRFDVAGGFFGEVELAKPLTRPVAAAGDDDPRVFFRLVKTF